MTVKKPFDLLEMFLVMAYEAGNEFNNEFRKEESERENYVFEVLQDYMPEHVKLLMKYWCYYGMVNADGAHARWRSLHEIAVVGCFIKRHGR